MKRGAAKSLMIIAACYLTVANATATTPFLDDCGQGDCIRAWVTSYNSIGDQLYSVKTKWAFYSDEHPNLYRDVREEVDTVSCKTSEPWVKIIGDGPEHRAYTDHESHASEDSDSLWDSICKNNHLK